MFGMTVVVINDIECLGHEKEVKFRSSYEFRFVTFR